MIVQGDKVMDGSTSVPLDRFSVKRSLGNGANAYVFLAYDQQLERLVALKIWPKRPLKPGDRRDKSLQALSEVRKLARLRHPNIVQVFDAFTLPDHYVVVMEYLPGESLKGVSGLQLWQRAWIGEVVASAMNFAHSSGVLHGDLHSGNVMVDSEALGENGVRVIDFGTSKFVRPENDRARNEARLLRKFAGRLLPEVGKIGLSNSSTSRNFLHAECELRARAGLAMVLDQFRKSRTADGAVQNFSYRAAAVVLDCPLLEVGDVEHWLVNHGMSKTAFREMIRGHGQDHWDRDGVSWGEPLPVRHERLVAELAEEFAEWESRNGATTSRNRRAQQLPANPDLSG